MKKAPCSRVGVIIASICIVFFCVWLSPVGKAASSLSKHIYLIGRYGSLIKLDADMEVISTQKIPSLARGNKVCGADLSHDGQRLFFALGGNNLFIAVQTEDMRIEDTQITFPATAEHWKTHSPFDIISVSPRYLYMTDECYSAVAKPFSSLLVDLNTKTAKPVYDFGFESKKQIQVSPDQKKMALCSHGIKIVNISTGNIIRSIAKDHLNGKWVLWSNIDWENNAIDLYTVSYMFPKEKAKKIEKSRIDMRTNVVAYTKTLSDETKFGFYRSGQIKKLQTTTSNVYMQDNDGNIQIFDRNTGKLTGLLDHMLFEKITGRPTSFYVSPDEKFLFYQKDKVKYAPDNENSRDISSICVLNLESKQLVKIIDYSEEIAAVLFETSSSPQKEQVKEKKEQVKEFMFTPYVIGGGIILLLSIGLLIYIVRLKRN